MSNLRLGINKLMELSKEVENDKFMTLDTAVDTVEKILTDECDDLVRIDDVLFEHEIYLVDELDEFSDYTSMSIQEILRTFENVDFNDKYCVYDAYAHASKLEIVDVLALIDTTIEQLEEIAYYEEEDEEEEA